MSKATSQAFSSYRRNRTVLSFRERYRLTVFVSNGTVAVMAQRGVSLKSVLTCYEKNKMIFFFIWAVIDFLTINISWFLLNIKQHPSPISRKPQTVLNVWMAWIVCIVLFSYHKCACPMSRAIAATFWPRGRRALRARRPRGLNVKNHIKFNSNIWLPCLISSWLPVRQLLCPPQTNPGYIPAAKLANHEIKCHGQLHSREIPGHEIILDDIEGKKQMKTFDYNEK